MKSLSIVLGFSLVLCGCSAKESPSLAQTYAAKAAKALDRGNHAEAKTMAIKAFQKKPKVAKYSVAVAFAARKLNYQSIQSSMQH